MAALRSRCGHYILPYDFYLSSFFFFFFPRLISAVGDWMSTIHTDWLSHMVSLSANSECMSENTGRKKSPSQHHRTTLSGHISATKAYVSTIGKNLLNINTSSTCSCNMVNFGLITAENRWRVWGTPANFNGLRVLAALLCGTPAVGVSQTLRRWTKGATYVRQGGHHVGHWPTFLVFSVSARTLYCYNYCFLSNMFLPFLKLFINVLFGFGGQFNELYAYDTFLAAFWVFTILYHRSRWIN